MAASTDVQVVPGTGVEVEQPVVEACDDGGSVSATTTTKKLESVSTVLQQQQPAVEACDDDGGSGASATTTTEESVKVLQEQHHDTAPDPDHHEVATPEHATEVSVAWNEPEEEEKLPAAKEDEVGEQQKAPPAGGGDDQESTRERLKRHRQEMAGRVWVPEKWGQEKLLKDWVDSAVFDRPLVPAGLLTARRALVAESFTRRPDRASTVSSAGSSPLRVRNGCST